MSFKKITVGFPQTITSQKDYMLELEKMDWFYDYSDDYSVWCMHQKRLDSLIEYAKKLDKNFVHYNHFCTNDKLRNGGNA